MRKPKDEAKKCGCPEGTKRVERKNAKGLACRGARGRFVRPDCAASALDELHGAPAPANIGSGLDSLPDP